MQQLTMMIMAMIIIIIIMPTVSTRQWSMPFRGRKSENYDAFVTKLPIGLKFRQSLLLLQPLLHDFPLFFRSSPSFPPSLPVSAWIFGLTWLIFQVLLLSDKRCHGKKWINKWDCYVRVTSPFSCQFPSISTFFSLFPFHSVFNDRKLLFEIIMMAAKIDIIAGPFCINHTNKYQKEITEGDGGKVWRRR